MRWALAAFALVPAFAEGPIHFGVKAGVPVTDIVAPQGEIGGRPSLAKVRRLTAGPLIQVRFPMGFRGELGAMFKSFRQEAGEVETRADPGSAFEQIVRPYSKSGRSLELPMVAQYYAGGLLARPYIEGGVVYNRLSDVLRPFRALTGTAGTVRPEARPHNRLGVVFGAGLELGPGRWKIAPGFRVTKYDQRVPFLKGNVSADVLVGLYF